jgi:histidyl-tRNA synthetase
MEGYMDKGVEVGNRLRREGIYTQIYIEPGKMGKKFNYADKLNIPYTIVIGEEEAKNDVYSLRDMKTGEQESLSMDEVLNRLK